MVLLPRYFPLSLLNGASPTSAAMALRFNVPNSGRAAMSAGDDGTDAGRAREDRFLLFPQGTFSDVPRDVLVDLP